MQYTEAMTYGTRCRYEEVAKSVLGENAQPASYSDQYWIAPTSKARQLCGGKLPGPGCLVYVQVEGARSAWITNMGGQYELTIKGLV